MSQNLNAAAYAAGIKGEDKRRIDNLSKAFATHQNLLNMPQDVANSVYNKLPESQQQNLVDTFGTESPDEGPKGLLGTAWHYTGYQAFKALQFASDRVSQTYRALAIPIIERKTLGFAWDEAGKDGEKVYNTNRLQKAKDDYEREEKELKQQRELGGSRDLMKKLTDYLSK